MPPSGEEVERRLLIACRLNGARNAYHDSLANWTNIYSRLQIGMRGGTPDLEASMRVNVYRWRAELYALRGVLENLRS